MTTANWLRFSGVHALTLITMLGLWLGGGWTWLGFLAMYGLIIAGDELLGDDYSEPRYRQPWLLNALLYASLPMLLLLCLLFAWRLGYVGLPLAAVALHSGVRASLPTLGDLTGLLSPLGAILSVALTFAAAGTNVGHELCHRTTDPRALTCGRWLLALTLNADFAVEHVYGHHRHLATVHDPASARRGEHFYAFLIRSITGQLRSAWQIERGRLKRLRRPVWSWRNRILRGWLMSACIAIGFFSMAGWPGLVGFVLAAAAGRSVLEAVNYFEHYGLVREVGAPVELRHSWNSNRRASNAVLFNLARHSHHHAEGDAAFWNLRAYRDAPTLPFGYLTCMLLVFVAPGWYRRRMTPLLLDWDRSHANTAERRLAAVANRHSGLRALETAAQV